MGYGFNYTPLYIPDPSDPSDVAESIVTHFVFAGATYAAAWALTGQYPGPGHLGIIHQAFFSKTPVGASNVVAYDDTMFALRTYSAPFRNFLRFISPVTRVLGPLGMAYTAMEVGRSLTGDDPNSGVLRDRSWLDEYHHQLSGGDYDWESARAQYSR